MNRKICKECNTLDNRIHAKKCKEFTLESVNKVKWYYTFYLVQYDIEGNPIGVFNNPKELNESLDKAKSIDANSLTQSNNLIIRQIASRSLVYSTYDKLLYGSVWVLKNKIWND